MSIDRTDALAELDDPATTGERLAEIAYAHPDLGARIVAHPHVYPDLVAWLTEHGDVGTAPEPDFAAKGAAQKNSSFGTNGKQTTAPATPPAPQGDATSKADSASTADAAAKGAAASQSAATSQGAPVLPRGLWAVAAGVGVVSMALGALTAVAAPRSAPAAATISIQVTCPGGSETLAWSEWDGGAAAVCRTVSGSTTMIVDDGGRFEESEATATATGFQSSVGEIAFGGWVTWPRDRDGAVATSWGHVDYGDFFDEPGSAAGIPACPLDSPPVSFSAWDGGWLLTCAGPDGTPTSFSYETDDFSGFGQGLTFADGQYCGVDDASRTVCVSPAPALVQVVDPAGTFRYTVASNFFDTSGFGGAGQGTGAYGVETPEDTAQEQVDYFAALLSNSHAARSTVSGVLAPLNACRVSSGDVQALYNLHQARLDLLSALRTAPVDQIPDGVLLLSELTDAISLSEQTIVGYISAAEQMAAGDCAGGRAIYRDALALADQAEAAKQRFVNSWNSLIVPTFGAGSWNASEI